MWRWPRIITPSRTAWPPYVFVLIEDDCAAFGVGAATGKPSKEGFPLARYDCGVAAGSFDLARMRRMKRSTWPPVSTMRCWPV